MTRERTVPVLPVRDVNAALAHYKKLGFVTEAYCDEGASIPIYGFATRGDLELHLACTADLDPKTNTSVCYVYVNEAEALHREWTSAGADGRFIEPVATPYGLREFAHIDPDGNLLRVGSEL
jgi:hypothetical protein